MAVVCFVSRASAGVLCLWFGTLSLWRLNDTSVYIYIYIYIYICFSVGSVGFGIAIDAFGISTNSGSHRSPRSGGGST